MPIRRSKPSADFAVRVLGAIRKAKLRIPVQPINPRLPKKGLNPTLLLDLRQLGSAKKSLKLVPTPTKIKVRLAPKFPKQA